MKGSSLSLKRARSFKQVSAGGVVFRESASKTFICLIARRSGGRLIPPPALGPKGRLSSKGTPSAGKAGGGIIWCLPKGHVEKGERLRGAAVREVKEETGILGSVCSSLGFIKYSFFDFETKRRIFKTVYFFLLRYLEGRLSDHDDEVEYARWFPISKVIEHAEYESEREVLQRALGKLKELE